MGKLEQKVVKDYVFSLLDEKLQRYARLAWWDLWYGPMTYCEDCGSDSLSDCKCEFPYPGFQVATEEIASALDVGDLWVEGDCVMTSEPDQYVEDDDGNMVEAHLEDTYYYPRKEVLRIAFSEVADYL